MGIGSYEKKLLVSLIEVKFDRLLQYPQFKIILVYILKSYCFDLVDNFKEFKKKCSDRNKIETYFKELKEDLKQIHRLKLHLQ